MVGFNGAFYKVILVNKLGDINLYAFNNTVTVDIYGNVINADYFYPDFSKYESCEMLDVRAACKREGVIVPEEIFTGEDVNIIYIYADSIIVPAYIIEGNLKGGKPYRAIVNGAVFG